MGSSFQQLVKMEPEDMSQSFRGVPPAHYIFKITSFSRILKNAIEKYESNTFESGGYKWKLLLYPEGNKMMNVQDHISLYLVMDEADTLHSGCEVNVTFKLFLFDQIRDRYLTVEDKGKTIRRFHVAKTEWGFSKFIPLLTFNEPSNGYLVNDTCVFGAEVFVCNSTGQGECFSMVHTPITSSYTWKITSFSSLSSQTLYSEYVSTEKHKWAVLLYPKGVGVESKNKFISLYVVFKDLAPQSREKIYAMYNVRVRDKLNSQHVEIQGIDWFTDLGWGRSKFMELSVLKDPNKGYLVDDTLIIEADVTILGSVKSFT